MEAWTWFAILTIIGIILWWAGATYSIGSNDECAVIGITLTTIGFFVGIVLFAITCSLKSNDDTNYETLNRLETTIIALYNSIKDTTYTEKNAVVFSTLSEDVNNYNDLINTCIDNRKSLRVNYLGYAEFKTYYYNPYNNTLYADGILVE